MVPRTIGGAVGKRLPFFVVFAGVAAFAAVETRPPPRQFCFFFFFFFTSEIPVLQLMGALYMGNKVVFKTDSKVRTRECCAHGTDQSPST